MYDLREYTFHSFIHSFIHSTPSLDRPSYQSPNYLSNNDKKWAKIVRKIPKNVKKWAKNCPKNTKNCPKMTKNFVTFESFPHRSFASWWRQCFEGTRPPRCSSSAPSLPTNSSKYIQRGSDYWKHQNSGLLNVWYSDPQLFRWPVPSKQ